MAKRPSVQEILEMARKGGAAKQPEAAEPAAPVEPEPTVAEEEAVEAAPEAAAPAPGPAANAPTPTSLGRPLTLQEKLAAARAGAKISPALATAAPSAGVPVPAKREEPDGES